MGRLTRVLLGLGLGLLAVRPVAAQTFPDFRQITIDNTSGGVSFPTAAVTPTGRPVPTTAVCTLRTAEVSFLIVDPRTTAVTATVGMLWEISETKTFSGQEALLNFRAIRTGTPSGQLDCTFVVAPVGQPAVASNGGGGAASFGGTLPPFGTPPSVLISDAAGNALTSTAGAADVNIKTSSVSSAVVTDAASVAAGTPTLAQTYSETAVYDGSVWRRLTIGTAGTASAQVLTVQGIAAMTKLLVTPDSVALPANQSVNVNQLAGTTTDTNSGSKSAGTMRVVLATDQPQLTAKLLVTPDNVATTAATAPTATALSGGVDASGNIQADVVCANSIIYDASTSGNTQLVAISGSKHVYVCSYTVFAAGTVNVSLVAGTGSACASAASGATSTGTSGASAALTPAYPFTTQTGMVRNAPTHGWLYDAGSANALCLKTSAGIAVQAEVWYKQQ